jgi:DNA modification methylase
VLTYRLIHADVLEGLRQLPDGSVQCVVTSPPYWGLRDYGIEPSAWGGDAMHAHEWTQGASSRSLSGGVGNGSLIGTQQGERKGGDLRFKVMASAFCECGAWRGCFGLEPTPEFYVEHAVMVFREVWRVLRDDGTLWLNLGDSYAANGTSGLNVTQPSTTFHGGKTDARQRERRVPLGLKPKDLVGIQWAVAFALRADGWYLRSDIVWHKPNPMPESVTDRPTKAHEYMFLLSKSERYLYDSDVIAEPAAYLQPNSPQSIKSPFTRRAKGNAKTFRGGGAYTLGQSFDNGAEVERESHGNAPNENGTRNKRSVWTVATAPFPEAHFATFPPDLIEPCILAGSGIGDTVLDPFSGAGTTGVVSLAHQRDYVGIELNGSYVEMSRRRLQGVAPMFAQEIAR